MNPEVFREYDVRGVVETDFDDAFLRDLGLAYAAKVTSSGRRRICLGRDGRLSSPRLHDRLLEGLLAGGLEVLDIGLAPTPVLYFAIVDLAADGGIMITGSHNPPEFNGFKICVGPETIHGEQIQELRRIIEARAFSQGAGSVAEVDVIPAYLTYLREHIWVSRPLKVVVDAGNGTGGLVGPQAIRDQGCAVVEMFTDIDGRFPNHFPDPTVPANLEALRARVLFEGADVGLAWDGDADRIGVVDERGGIIWGDELLILFGREVLSRHPGATIIGEVKCSQRLYADLAAKGGRALMWKAGHSLIKSKMREEGALLAGEMSGHIFFKDRYFGFDDAIYASLRVLEIIASEARPLSALLADLPPSFSTPEIRVPCPDAAKFGVVARLTERFRARYRVCDIDGARVEFEGGAWGLVRASNTQPVLVLRFEAPNAERLDEVRELVEAEVRGELDRGGYR
jgi:phosphomannomutase/phosphoglucomutase